MDRISRVKYLKSSNYGLFGFELPCGAVPPRRQGFNNDDELLCGVQNSGPRSRRSRVQAEQLALARHQQRRPSHVRFSPQFVPPASAQQRAPSYNWQQLQASPQAQAQPQPQPRAQAQAQAEIEPQSQGAMHYNQSPVYADPTNIPQQQTAMYRVPRYDPGQIPRAQGSGQNYETVTVGHAFMQQMFAERVPAHALPSYGVDCMQEPRQGKEPPACEETLRYESLCGAQGGPSALSESRKGKEPMRLEIPLEQSRARGSFEIEHISCGRIPLDSASNSGSYCFQLEEVTESWERSFVGLEDSVSELHQAVVPDDELPAEQGIQISDIASECYGSPGSDIYEDVRSCSSTISSPERIDA